MAEAARFWQRYGSGLVSALAGVLIFWVALHARGGDWFISHTHADILFTAVWSFHEFPFFSFVFGGGTYFLQDPQSNLFSIANPLVLLAGPTVGLRLAEAFWGVAGCYAFILWMRRHVSEVAAQLGGISMCASLAVFWRVAVGNDMFLWHLGLPILLLLIERLVASRTWRSAVAFGLAFGIFLMGPTFHSFTYLFAPVLPLFVIAALIIERPSFVNLCRISLLFALAFVLAFLIASPKFACWARFPMGRPTFDANTGVIDETLRSLFDFSNTAWSKYQMGFYRRGRRLLRRWWGIQEAATALPPIASLLAPIGLVGAFFSKRRLPYAVLAVILVLVGIGIATTDEIWAMIRALSHDGIRVAPRFHAVAWFGLAVLATLGADVVLSRWQRAAVPMAMTFLATVVASTVWWTYTAGRVAPRTETDNILPSALNPFTTMAEEFASVSKVKSIDRLVSFDLAGRYLLKGDGIRDGFMVVGNVERTFANGQEPELMVRRREQGSSTVSHTRIEVRDIAPHETVDIAIGEPQFGVRVRTVPAAAKVELTFRDNSLRVQNVGDDPIESLVLRPKFPIARAWFALSLLVLLGCSVVLTYPRWGRHRAVAKHFARFKLSV